MGRCVGDRRCGGEIGYQVNQPKWRSARAARDVACCCWAFELHCTVFCGGRATEQRLLRVALYGLALIPPDSWPFNEDVLSQVLRRRLALTGSFYPRLRTCTTCRSAQRLVSYPDKWHLTITYAVVGYETPECVTAKRIHPIRPRFWFVAPHVENRLATAFPNPSFFSKTRFNGYMD